MPVNVAEWLVDCVLIACGVLLFGLAMGSLAEAVASSSKEARQAQVGQLMLLLLGHCEERRAVELLWEQRHRAPPCCGTASSMLGRPCRAATTWEPARSLAAHAGVLWLAPWLGRSGIDSARVYASSSACVGLH